jgi:hypothetical protein
MRPWNRFSLSFYSGWPMARPQPLHFSRSSVIQSNNQDLALSALEEAARFKPSISILSIFSMAFMTR